MRSVALGALLLVLLATVGSSPAAPHRAVGFAPAGALKAGSGTCAPGKTCSYTCPKGGCKVSCEKESTCEATCSGGKCSQECGPAARWCNFTCSGGSCTQICRKGTRCDLTCSGGSCKRTCEEGAICKSTCSGQGCS